MTSAYHRHCIALPLHSPPPLPPPLSPGVRGSLSSPLLRRLVTPGQGFPDLAPRLAALRQAADWETAEKEGRVVPAAGVDAACDEAAQAVEEAEGALESFLQETQRGVCRHARFVSVGSQSHLVEVPDSDTGRVPKDWELAGTRKGFRRYTCPDLADLVKALDAARRAREAALSASLAALLRRFGAEGATWRSAVRACAHLDALMSLAVHAQVSEKTRHMLDICHVSCRCDWRLHIHAHMHHRTPMLTRIRPPRWAAPPWCAPSSSLTPIAAPSSSQGASPTPPACAPRQAPPSCPTTSTSGVTAPH